MKKLLTKVQMLCAVLLTITLLQPELTVAQRGGGKFTLNGTVQGDGQPLVGATIVEPGTSNGTVTGSDGKFSLSLSKRGASIQVSFIGYQTKTLTANADFLEIALDSDTQAIDEVMVVAYGTMRKRDVTGSIASISSESIERKIPSSVFDALQGQVAGVQITAGSGQPGESAQINIRGISTFSAEGVKPLYVVDGIPMEDIDAINPGDIVSIEVLKDAASAAMYGSRSANGVILITTKGGQEGAPRVDVKYLHSWGKLSHKLAQATRADRRNYDMLRRTYFLENSIGSPDESYMIIQDSLNSSFNVDNDYQDLLFQWAQKDQVDLSVSGGTKKMKYYGSTGYYNERGIVPNTNFQRLTARINADYTANNWLTLHSRVSLGYSQKNGLDESALMTSMLSRRPYFNLYYPDGTLAGVFQGQKSPLAQVKYTTDRTEYYQANFYQGFEVKLAKNLTFQTSINANFYLNKRQRVYPSMITDEWQTICLREPQLELAERKRADLQEQVGQPQFPGPAGLQRAAVAHGSDRAVGHQLVDGLHHHDERLLGQPHAERHGNLADQPLDGLVLRPRGLRLQVEIPDPGDVPPRRLVAFLEVQPLGQLPVGIGGLASFGRELHGLLAPRSGRCQDPCQLGYHR